MRFKKIYIEITNRCNLNCSFCSSTGREEAVLSPDQFAHIIKRIKPYTDYLYLHVKGEPLMHPHLDGLLDICGDNRMKTNIVTNGTLIRTSGDMLLKKAALRQINFSLHCYDELPAHQDKTEYLRNIVDFAKRALAESRLYISLRIWNSKDGRLTPSGAGILNFLEEVFDVGINPESLGDKGFKISDRLYLNIGHEFRWPSLGHDVAGEEGFCQGMRDQIAILADGTVVPCCLDAKGVIDLGNIFTEEFSRIVEGERAKMIYDGFSRNKAVESLCRRCTYKNRFE